MSDRSADATPGRSCSQHSSKEPTSSLSKLGKQRKVRCIARLKLPCFCLDDRVPFPLEVSLGVAAASDTPLGGKPNRAPPLEAICGAPCIRKLPPKKHPIQIRL
eukprot:1190838-Prorocentrum_minimum.AAC.1